MSVFNAYIRKQPTTKNREWVAVSQSTLADNEATRFDR